MKILIVEDNKENLIILEAILKGNHYDVESANNGAEALEKLRIAHLVIGHRHLKLKYR